LGCPSRFVDRRMGCREWMAWMWCAHKTTPFIHIALVTWIHPPPTPPFGDRYWDRYWERYWEPSNLTQMLSCSRTNNGHLRLAIIEFPSVEISSVGSGFFSGCPSSFVDRRMRCREWMAWMWCAHKTTPFIHIASVTWIRIPPGLPPSCMLLICLDLDVLKRWNIFK
jgi:hypothetical protein